MSLRVPFFPPKLAPLSTERNDIKNATPVYGPGTQWRAMAEHVNWLLGRGGQIIACGPVLPAQTTTTGTMTALFYHWPRAQHTTRLWLVGLRVDAELGYSSGQITFQSTGNPTVSGPYTVPSEPGKPTQFVEFVDNLTVSTVGFVGFAMNPTVGNTVRVDSVVCVEMPRHTLDSSASSLGAVADTCDTRAAIYADAGTSSDKLSVSGVHKQLIKANTRVRRQKMFDCFRASGMTITTTAFTGSSNLFYVDPAVQTRHLGSGDTVDEVAWAVYAKVNSGTGEVRVTAASGDTSTLQITATTMTVYTGVVDVETDDFSRADLIRGATRDTLTFEARNDTSTSITVYGISVGEA